MSSTRIVAASLGAVEALKDHGFCRWNYAIRSIHHKAKTNIIKSFSNKKLSTNVDSSFSGIVMLKASDRIQKAKQAEESLRNVMYLSCWVFISPLAAVLCPADRCRCLRLLPAVAVLTLTLT
ncbi:hypothetical protein BUALT_Bualt03G0199100 [Buddleja alternifolia]|uniref:Wound-responsive family protein n=1 Tax=Buddleja alternifolia TaxID=168488 RepID=A0AAV6XV86_9LAMI|nr:hypothetical protein BUALT_Bualt03G0199100 [Buddleja alternifolia]